MNKARYESCSKLLQGWRMDKCNTCLWNSKGFMWTELWNRFKEEIIGWTQICLAKCICHLNRPHDYEAGEFCWVFIILTISSFWYVFPYLRKFNHFNFNLVHTFRLLLLQKIISVFLMVILGNRILSSLPSLGYCRLIVLLQNTHCCPGLSVVLVLQDFFHLGCLQWLPCPFNIFQ